MFYLRVCPRPGCRWCVPECFCFHRWRAADYHLPEDSVGRDWEKQVGLYKSRWKAKLLGRTAAEFIKRKVCLCYSLKEYSIDWVTKSCPLSQLVPPCRPVKSRGALVTAFSPDGQLLAIILNQKDPRVTYPLIVWSTCLFFFFFPNDC